MKVLIATSVIVSVLTYFVFGSLSIGYVVSDTEPSCSNRYFMTIEQWMLGMGIGHLICGVLLTAAAILYFIKLWPIPLGFIGFCTILYIFIYSVIGSVVLAMSRYCLIVKEPLYTLAIFDIVVNFTLCLAMGIIILIIIISN